LTEPEQAAGLVAGPKWPLAKTAWRLARELPPGRSLGLVCRGCDARAVAEMEKLNQLRLGTVLPIGLSCSPAQAQACRCATPFPPGADPRPGINLSGIGDAPSLTAGPDRLDRWQAHFSRCLKCYGCRNVCPVCTCPTCKLEDDAYVPLGSLPPDPLAFHLIRAMHVADRCVACGACQDSCPSGLPLLALHQAARRALQERTGYLSGSSEPSPLLLAGRREGPLGMAQPQWTDTLSDSSTGPGGPGGLGGPSGPDGEHQAGGRDHG
jgi:ferredoxin